VLPGGFEYTAITLNRNRRFFGPDAEPFLQSRNSRVRRTRWRREGDFEPSLSVGGQQVAKPEGITTDLLADGKLYRIAEGRPIKNKGVKLSVLAARVDLRRKLREKLLVDPPPEKRRVKPGFQYGTGDFDEVHIHPITSRGNSSEACRVSIRKSIIPDLIKALIDALGPPPGEIADKSDDKALQAVAILDFNGFGKLMSEIEE
jgi:hypothetical protein